jgi:serine/threonine-protein kinase PknK
VSRSYRETAILIVSADVQVQPVAELLATGAKTGHLLKRRESDVDTFVSTLSQVVAGANIVAPSLVQELIEMKRLDDPLEVLSPREPTRSSRVNATPRFTRGSRKRSRPR